MSVLTRSKTNPQGHLHGPSEQKKLPVEIYFGAEFKKYICNPYLFPFEGREVAFIFVWKNEDENEKETT